MTKRVFVLAHDQARRRAAELCHAAPDGIVVTFAEPRRTLDQNAKLHATLQELGESMGWKWCGQDVDLDDLKSVFVSAFRKATGQGARFVIGIDGQPVILNWRTRSMSRRECADLIEMIHAFAAERRIEIDRPACQL